MTKTNKYTKDQFKISAKDVSWSVKVFMRSVALAFIIGIAAYILMLIFAEPEPVSKAIVSTASAATAKVTVTSNYINLMWAIFFFNSIAASCAIIGTGLFMLVQSALISDIHIRSRHHIYTRCSILFEKMIMPVYEILIKITTISDKDFSSIGKNEPEMKDTVWQYCGYGKDEYRMFSYILPYTVPLIILMVNGFLMGILLAFFTFNGAMTGFEILGTKGIALGLFYNVIYFFISILPHGIIEIPTLLVAASLGYRFAYIQAHDVIDKELFNGNDIKSLKEDVSYALDTTKNYILSGYIWKMLALVVLLLLIAAYIETYVTLGIVDKTMEMIDNGLASLIDPE
ncbi:stage II sporulation protein M [Methanolobus psychrotolerans]|uniref:stage II sporulation protein M n=1 Tax=Methanolobus psychrotolerans TaxID=1874706 RepID=UPI000B91CB3F|nr:stage II sporulation protein M [Methanolobus psychrotolerans]